MIEAIIIGFIGLIITLNLAPSPEELKKIEEKKRQALLRKYNRKPRNYRT